MNTKMLRMITSALILMLLFTVASSGIAENGIRIDGQIGFDGVVLQGGAWRLTLNIENHSEKDINGYISVNTVKNVYDDYDEMRLPVKLAAIWMYFRLRRRISWMFACFPRMAVSLPLQQFR